MSTNDPEDEFSGPDLSELDWDEYADMLAEVDDIRQEAEKHTVGH